MLSAADADGGTNVIKNVFWAGKASSESNGSGSVKRLPAIVPNDRRASCCHKAYEAGSATAG